MQGRRTRALGIAAVVLQLGMPGLALAHAAADASAAPMGAAIATWLSGNFGVQARPEDPRAALLWPINIAALRYRGLASYQRG